MNTVIIADSCSDLPHEFVQKNRIPIVHFVYQIKGKELFDDFGSSMPYKEFYNEMRSKEMPTTSQVNVVTFVELFKHYVQKGQSIIYLAFSSALSGTYNSAVIARDMVMEEYKEADITVIDTKSASLGEGLLVYYAVEMLNKGASKQEIIDWVENNKLRLNHWFTVEDLGHLKRGGRLSGSAAFIGTILDIKPVLKVDREGRLVPAIKAKGRKKSVRILSEKLFENIENPQDQVIAISHGDDEDSAQYLADLIRKSTPVKDILINPIGPVIGSHAGPGTIALFFLGKER